MAPKVQFSKDHIIKSALEYSKEFGLSNLTVRKLAAKLGCSVAPIYVNFKNSAELIEAVVQKIRAISWEYSTKPYSKTGFFNIGIGQVLFARDFPNLFKDLLELDPSSFVVPDGSIEAMMDVMSKDEFLKDLDREQCEKLLFMMRQYTNGICLSILKKWDEKPIEYYIYIMEEMAHHIIHSMLQIEKHESALSEDFMEEAEKLLK